VTREYPATVSVSNVEADNHAMAEDVVSIRATDIRKRFGHLEALRGASLEIREGEILALVGDNGAGKSTLAKIICGAVAPDEGELSFWGETVVVQSISHAYELGVGVVYQDLSLALDLSVADNLFLGREPSVRSWSRFFGVLDRNRMRAEARTALSRLGINLKTLSTPTRNLSGGQRQALALARAMLWAKRAVLLDEPTAALGPKQTGIVFDTVRRAADQGLAVLVISHDIPRILTIADRIAVLRHGLVVTTGDAKDLHLNEVLGMMLGAEVPAA
jgi:simple sugar transport system ATP-binding protein